MCPPSLIMQLLPYLDCIDTSVEALKQNEADLQKNPKPNKPTPEKEENNKQTQLQMTETCLCCLYFTGLRLPLKYLEQLSWLSMTSKFSENGSNLLRLKAVTSETGTSKWKDMLREELRCYLQFCKTRGILIGCNIMPGHVY